MLPRRFGGIACFALAVVATGLSGCATFRDDTGATHELAPFTTDGCSLFPDGTFADKTRWQDCCTAHDIAYWQGGSSEDRRRADRELRDCILEKTGDAALARLVYDGVRSGGSPVFPTWYRWGYGWSYGRPYRPLTAQELQQVAERLREHSAPDKVEPESP